MAFLILGLGLLVGGKLGGKSLDRSREVPPTALQGEPTLTLEEFKRRSRVVATGMVWVGALCLSISAASFVASLVT